MSAINMIEIPVREIAPNIRPWFITVRVIRMWNNTFCSRLSRVFSVEFVVIDVHGDKIQASVSWDILRLKRIDMDEGDFIRVSTSVVVPNDGKDRATRHAFRLVVEMCSIGSLECVLYDEYVEDVRWYLKNNGPCTPVVVIQFARIAHEG
ncbi:Nucleic acid-binding, OB-fold, partial [Sesbania bispinosa]